MSRENTWALVVEDDALHLIAVTMLLKELQLPYKRNTTGLNVLQQTRAMSPRPGIILLDMNLPYENSFTICMAIRSDPALVRVPVIAMGGREWLDRRQELRARGFTAVVEKPLSRKQFKGLLQAILAGKPGWLDIEQPNSTTSSGR